MRPEVAELLAATWPLRPSSRGPGLITAVWLVAVALAMANGVKYWAPGPSGTGTAAVLQAEMSELLLWEVFLPRLAVSLLAGGASRSKPTTNQPFAEAVV